MTDNRQMLARLQAGVSCLKLQLDDDALVRMLAYIGLLEKWNRSYNLTSVRRPEQMLTRHILDSLAILPFIEGGEVLDVGSGAGLPGLVLALALPERRFTLLDSNNKKIRFITQACIELGIGNVLSVRERLESWRGGAGFSTITARAFSSLKSLFECASPLLADDAVILAMKGVLPAAELAELGDLERRTEVHRLTVPGLEAERHVVIYRPGR